MSISYFDEFVDFYDHNAYRLTEYINSSLIAISDDDPIVFSLIDNIDEHLASCPVLVHSLTVEQIEAIEDSIISENDLSLFKMDYFPSEFREYVYSKIVIFDSSLCSMLWKKINNESKPRWFRYVNLAIENSSINALDTLFTLISPNHLFINDSSALLLCLMSGNFQLADHLRSRHNCSLFNLAENPHVNAEIVTHPLTKILLSRYLTDYQKIRAFKLAVYEYNASLEPMADVISLSPIQAAFSCSAIIASYVHQLYMLNSIDIDYDSVVSAITTSDVELKVKFSLFEIVEQQIALNEIPNLEAQTHINHLLMLDFPPDHILSICQYFLKKGLILKRVDLNTACIKEYGRQDMIPYIRKVNFRFTDD